jgi:hypothetical protein
MTPTEHAHSLGIFDDGTDEKNKEEVIGWENEYV